MHGARGGEDRSHRRRHMWPVPPAPGSPTTTPLTPPDASDCYLKGGRKIQAGDCALFQAGDTLPFIGLVRWFSSIKEDHPKLCVTWLYRPADVKLAKGVLLEAAPNEVFYSFHKDVISAASLLHPCKVAFLRKGVKLPPEVSSFVCWRVYDIETKSLCWLTDQDYVNERQTEVDKLLSNTHQEMHAAVQPGGRSPKKLNVPSLTQQLKPDSESVPSTAISFPSQVKGKKRDRSDQCVDPNKRERYTKKEASDIAASGPNMMKAEVAKITEKEGLSNPEVVERLVHLMQLDKTEKKLDFSGRVLVANSIAATDKADCLGKFVLLKGVPVLDDWLQEAQRGMLADDVSSPGEIDKAEGLVLALLRALHKLPVNLNALKTCNIGKSVNCLRSHKNLDIQNRARKLVENWKKGVNEEITANARNVGSGQPILSPGKPSLPEVSHAGSKRGSSTDIVIKSCTSQTSACRAPPGKSGHAEGIVKSTPLPHGSLKLPGSAPSDSIFKTAVSSETSELPQTTAKEEKSSSSSQSQNNSQSCSSDHAKTVGSSGKEDARSSSAGSLNASKSSGGSSRHRRPNSGLLPTGISAGQKESNCGKSGSLDKTTTLDKTTQSGLNCGMTYDSPVEDSGNGHRLTARLPNTGLGRSQVGAGGSPEEPSIIRSRTSSPSASDRHDSTDRKIKVRSEPSRSQVSMNVNTESWKSCDAKAVVASVGVDQSLIAILDEESRSADDAEKANNVSATACSPPGKEKGVFLDETAKTRDSFSSMNALIESCANHSEASAPLSVGDDVGMNLLASVAAGEMSKTNLASPAGSPRRLPTAEYPCVGSDALKPGLQFDDAKDETQVVGTDRSGDSGIIMKMQENKLAGDQNGQHPVSNLKVNEAADSNIQSEGKRGAEKSDSHLSRPTTDPKEEYDHDGAFSNRDKQKTAGQVTDSLMDCQNKLEDSSTNGNKSIDVSHEKIAQGNLHASDLMDHTSGGECHIDSVPSGGKPEKLLVVESSSPVDTRMERGASTEQQPTDVVEEHAENVGKKDSHADTSAETGKSEGADSKVKFSDSIQIDQLEKDGSAGKKSGNLASPSVDMPGFSALTSIVDTSSVAINIEREGGLENLTGSSKRESSCSPAQETAKCSKSARVSGGDADRDVLLPSSKVVASEPQINPMRDFDLNEGIGDDGNENEQATSAALHGLFMPAPTAAATITVAAAAKGPFLPPDSLIKSKAEPGWKGSAATSAFRPAEPRKALEMPIVTNVPAADTVSGKHRWPLLDIDLNVADEGVLEDMAPQSSLQTTGSESGAISNHDSSARSTGGLDLDLNRVDEGAENTHHFVSASHRRLDMPLLPVVPALGAYRGLETNVSRGFDLNNGPSFDEVGIESMARSQHAKSNISMPFLPAVTGPRMNNPEFGNISSWYPPGNSYPAVALPAFLPDRGEQPYPVAAAAGGPRMLGPVSGGGTYGGDIYRGPVLSSSPAMAFSPAAAYPYPDFTFGHFPGAPSAFTGVSTTYVDSSSGFPAIPPQLVGPAAAVSPHYPRPYMLGLAEGSSTAGSESNRKWLRQGLDLNAGPGTAEMDTRFPASSRPLSLSHTQTEEHARMYQAAGSSGLKRKEPEGGMDTDRHTYKHPSWN